MLKLVKPSTLKARLVLACSAHPAAKSAGLELFGKPSEDGWVGLEADEFSNCTQYRMGASSNSKLYGLGAAGV